MCRPDWLGDFGGDPLLVLLVSHPPQQRSSLVSTYTAGTMSLATVTIDDFSSLWAYAGAWSAPDTSARGYPSGNTFLETLVRLLDSQSACLGRMLIANPQVDGTYHIASAAQASVSFNFTGAQTTRYMS